MDSQWKTFGHEQIKLILAKHVQRGYYPHAYLFSGPEGIGKKMLAMDFAEKVLQTDKLQVHPDFQLYDNPGEISVESIRDFLPGLSYKPLMGKYKVAIINNSHNLNTQAANALLKTLEEPSASTIIILVGDAGRHLPTILSRCQVLSMQVFSPELLRKFSSHSGLDAPEDLLTLSFGLPARLKMLRSDSELAEQERDKVKQWQEIKRNKIAERLLMIGKLADLENEDLGRTLTTWLYNEQQELGRDPASFRKLGALVESLAGLEANKNKKVLLQGLFLKI